MNLTESSQYTESGHSPKCVAHLLATLEALSAALANDRPNGPFALDAVLDDVILCPAMETKPGLSGDVHEALVEAVGQARNAARVVRTCPGSDRKWAVERLTDAVAHARRQLAARVHDADASSHHEGPFGQRCETCVFAGK